MNEYDNYIEINRKSWNNRVDSHLKSDFYNLKGFIAGESSLNSIELEFLKDIKGKTVLHLQCHFGQDSISLERLGAKVVGVDFSDEAIKAANALANQLESDTEFICCDLYDLPNHVDFEFDYVFTSYGTIGWLPDINKWAKIVERFLKPGGTFVFAEFHPVVWMFDDQFDAIVFPYFKENPIVETESGTYANRESKIITSSITWNHGLAEVMQALVDQGLKINKFKEYNYSPFNCFQKAVEIAPNQFAIENLEGKIPMVYALVATKNEK